MRTPEKMFHELYKHFGVDPTDDEAIDRLYEERRAEVDAWWAENEPRIYAEHGYTIIKAPEKPKNPGSGNGDSE